ncbi:transposase [Rhizobium laguerreae]|nr:transposase [Rhizobium laguerreae]
MDFSRPGKPTENAFIDGFNGRFRAECLNQHWFLTLADARKKMEDWRRYAYEATFVNPSSSLPTLLSIGCSQSSGRRRATTSSQVQNP